jgi:Protein of unknown function (DUF3224)
VDRLTTLHDPVTTVNHWGTSDQPGSAATQACEPLEPGTLEAPDAALAAGQAPRSRSHAAKSHNRLERVRVTVAGRDGSLVLQHVGAFRDGAARASLTVVPGWGTEDLSSVSGAGDFLADPAGSVTLDLMFE